MIYFELVLMDCSLRKIYLFMIDSYTSSIFH